MRKQMKKVAALTIVAHVLLTLAIWSATHGLAYSLRDVPLEQQVFLLDITTIREEWILTTLGLSAGAFILLIVSFGAYISDRKDRRH
jgi:riboflavin transporter FmnP